MEKHLLSVLVALVALSCSRAQAQESTPPCPLGDGYEFAPELSDEFNGDSLDLDKWFDFNPAWRGRKPALFSRKNVAVADGSLHLTASLMKPEEVEETYEEYEDAGDIEETGDEAV